MEASDAPELFHQYKFFTPPNIQVRNCRQFHCSNEGDGGEGKEGGKEEERGKGREDGVGGKSRALGDSLSL